VVSRTIVDVVDPKARATTPVAATPDQDLVGRALGMPHVIAVSTGRLDAIESIARAYGQLDADAAGRLFASSGVVPAKLRQDAVATFSGMLGAYATSLVAASDRGLAALRTTAGSGVRIYRDQPLVAVVSPSVHRSRDQQRWMLRLAVDLRHNAVRVVPASSSLAGEAFWTNVRAGLMDGALERHMTAYLRTATADSPGSPRAEYVATSSVVAEALAQHVDVRAVADEDARRLLRDTVPSPAGYRLAEEVGPETAAVFPVRPVSVGDEQRFGMWKLDLQTGHIV
jgi:hypothetical protein